MKKCAVNIVINTTNDRVSQSVRIKLSQATVTIKEERGLRERQPREVARVVL